MLDTAAGQTPGQEKLFKGWRNKKRRGIGEAGRLVER